MPSKSFIIHTAMFLIGIISVAGTYLITKLTTKAEGRAVETKIVEVFVTVSPTAEPTKEPAPTLFVATETPTPTVQTFRIPTKRATVTPTK